MNWKKRIIQGFWILAAAGTVVLLAAAMQQKAFQSCEGVAVEISGASEQVFMDESDIMDMIRLRSDLRGTPVTRINLRDMEESLEKDPWIKNAELFFDNRYVLQVQITEREPVARIFTNSGYCFYVDSTGKQLPLSEKVSARVPVFTGFPTAKLRTGADSALLMDVIRMGTYIGADSFWNAQVGQVNITGDAFELVPVIGDHLVYLGEAEDMENKFRKLFGFYKNVSSKVGFNKYELINLAYDGQVVARKRSMVQNVSDTTTAPGDTGTGLKQANN